MTSTPDPQRLSASSKRTTLLASFGGALEYYDFIYGAEVAPRRASFACGFVFFCVMGGVVLATVFSLLIQAFMPADLIAAVGWRIPFWIGGALGLVGFWVRRSLEESLEFERIKRRSSPPQSHIRLKFESTPNRPRSTGHF